MITKEQFYGAVKFSGFPIVPEACSRIWEEIERIQKVIKAKKDIDKELEEEKIRHIQEVNNLQGQLHVVRVNCPHIGSFVIDPRDHDMEAYNECPMCGKIWSKE